MMLVTRQKRQTRLRHLVLPLLTVLCTAYFTYHAFEGDYGIRSREQMKSQALQLESQLAAISVEREKLEWRVQLLQDGSIERDMIDERARRNLGVVHADEIVILR